MKTWALRQLRESAGQYAASVAVVAVVSTFAVLLLETIAVFGVALRESGMDDIAPVQTGLLSVGLVFLGTAVLVAAIVISNTFSMIYAGRMRDIALLRLIGATGKQVRRTSLLDGAAVGLAGAVLGIVAGGLLSLVGISLVNATTGADLGVVIEPQIIIVPLVGSVIATIAASYSGSRAVSRVAPSEAARSMPEGQSVPERASRARSILGIVLVVGGLALLTVGLVVGVLAPFGILIAFPGGALSIIGIIVAAPVLLPPVLALITRALPSSAAARLAGANLRHDPVRTSRTVLAMVIGVTLLTMFTVAGQMFIESTRRYFGEDTAQVSELIDGLLTTVYVLTSFSVIVAAIGLGSTLSMSVLQRRRELGVLRALGLTTRQARTMLLSESLLVAVVGIIVGLALGVGYGFVGANSVLGSQYFGPPIVPPLFLLAVVVGGLSFGAVASLAPGHRASRVPPAEALRQV